MEIVKKGKVLNLGDLCISIFRGVSRRQGNANRGVVLPYLPLPSQEKTKEEGEEGIGRRVPTR